MGKKERIIFIIAAILGVAILATIVVLDISGVTMTERQKERNQEAVEKMQEVESVEIKTDDNRDSVSAYNDGDSSDISDTDISDKPDTDIIRESATTVPETTRTAEELASEVINQGINGDEREAYLGDRYREVQQWIDANYEPPYVEEVYYAESYDYPSGNVLTPEAGVNYYNGVMETYYNMPMDGLIDLLYSLGYSGEYWIRADGVKMWNEYVIVAADYSYEPRGTIVQTSLGTGVVLDTGLGGWGWHDIAVAW